MENVIIRSEENTMIESEHEDSAHEDSAHEESAHEDSAHEDTEPTEMNLASFYDLNYKLKYKDIDINNLDYTQDNTSILEKYDQTYREDLLLLFKLGFTLALTKDLNGVLNSCSKCISQIYEQYKDNEQIIKIMFHLKDEVIVPFELDDNTLFLYLFSCDYLEYFHECLKDLYYFKEISETNFNNLINKINEN